ncbi:hypothetical protein VM1G_09630 [Cytospora mali]|uniref:Uncharacterized protein n=1 Tax=Cytospora mali TaxID=578113 RepID=A0A194WBF1_CYTMA|nr:hypothetical protein VM1G_09630 [Valsa mali]
MRLCNENSRKKAKKQGGESETKASSRSPDTCNVAINCESQELRSGRGFDGSGLRSESHVGEQEDEVDYDDDDDDEDNGSGSEYNANDAGDHSLGFFDQDMTMSNGSVPRCDIVNSTASSGLWTDYPDCNGSGIHLPSVVRQNGRLTPLLTPTRTWTPTTTDQSASSTTFKSALFSPAHQMPPSSDTLPRDYSSFVGNVHNFAGNMHEAANDPMAHPFQLNHVDLVSSRSPDIIGLQMPPQMPEPLDRNQSPPGSTTNTVSGDGSHHASDTDPEKPNVRASASYQVDLVVICSSAQIEAIMKGVEGIGVLKSMKVGPRRTSSIDSRNS